jgi:PIN domain nuclease of toxin-antitoxin system
VKLLLDTHVLLWWLSDTERLPPAIRSAVEAAGPEAPLWVSDITLWEIATLESLGRIDLGLPLRDWLERATAPPLVRRLGITPAVAAEVAVLPDDFHRDPADRVLVASARVLGATLATADRRILDAEIVATLS